LVFRRTLGTSSASHLVRHPLIYDAEGHRVHRAGVITDTCDGTGKRDYVFDLAGNWVGEYSSNGTGCKSEIYAGSRHLVTYAGGTPLFIHSDWLGTVRLRNNATYPTYNFQTCTSLPFGDALSCAGGSQSTLHFTGKERDFESGLDNFGARYDSSAMGRFMSPDPENAGASVNDPQSWNAYSYVLNNPLNSVDPTGLDCIYIDNDTGKQTGFNRGDCDNSTEEKANSGYYVDGTVDRSSIQTLDNWIAYVYKPDGSPLTFGGGQCWGSCPNGATLVTAPINVPTIPGPGIFERGNPINDRIEAWINRVTPAANIISAFTGLDPSYGYCGPDAEHGPEDADHPKQQTNADEEANNMKEVKDSRPKRPGPAPTRNPNGSLNAERAGALAEVPGLINNGLRCVANGGVPKH
jgi:RHS repeat-associated protein